MGNVVEKTVVALFFNTDRSPFVVKNPVFGQPSAGPVEREVPWREGTAVRTARREDLIRLLAPIRLLPDVELLSARLTCHYLAPKEGRPTRYGWELDTELYISSSRSGRMIIPYHKCEARFSIGPFLSDCDLGPITLKPRKRRLFVGHEPMATDTRLSKTVDATASEALVEDAGLVLVHAKCETDPIDDAMLTHGADITLLLRTADSDRSVCVVDDLSPPKRGFNYDNKAPTIAWTRSEKKHVESHSRLKSLPILRAIRSARDR